jgi:hypothetical protein
MHSLPLARVAASTRRALVAGDDVLVEIRFRGREIQHPELAAKLLTDLIGRPEPKARLATRQWRSGLRRNGPQALAYPQVSSRFRTAAVSSSRRKCAPSGSYQRRALEGNEPKVELLDRRRPRQGAGKQPPQSHASRHPPLPHHATGCHKDRATMAVFTPRLGPLRRRASLTPRRRVIRSSRV